MNRKEIKSFLPILQAFADGKEIECREEDKWYRVLEICNEMNPQDYRIKPEPKYRPFKNAEECWTEMLKHQPFGYTYDRFNNIRDSITKVATTGVSYDSPTVVISFEEVFDRFVFADGGPFGVKVEE
jgi:hypothetical protein